MIFTRLMIIVWSVRWTNTFLLRSQYKTNLSFAKNVLSVPSVQVSLSASAIIAPLTMQFLKGGAVVIADTGYWKRVEVTNSDYSLLQEKVVLYRCAPGNCMGSVKYAMFSLYF
jgi:hypothetical protein